VGDAVTQILAGAAIDGVAQGRGGKVLFTEPPPSASAYAMVTIGAADSPYAAAATPAPHLIVIVDTSAGAVTVVLPASPDLGAIVTVTDLSGLHANHKQITIDGNGNDTEGDPQILMKPVPTPVNFNEFKSYTLLYVGAAGWRIVWLYAGLPPGGTP
jgi:hypothetical protein